MLAYAQGDATAFEQLYSRHERAVYRFLLRSVKIPAVAEDLLQDVFVGVIGAAGRYVPQAQFTTWLYRVARNRLIDHWRAHEPEVVRGLESDDEEGFDPIEGLAAQENSQPENIAMDRARARDFVCAVQDLPAAQREAFLLHAEAGLTLEQIGEIAGCERETVKSRYRYACAKLRERLKAWQEL